MRPLAAHVRRRLIDQAARDLLRSRALLDDSLELLADSVAGHPRAARYDGHDEQSARLHCFEHEQDRRRCEIDGMSCGGVPVTGSDPTGEAAVSRDRASEALATVDRAVTALAVAAAALVTEIVAWSPPKSAVQRPDRRAVTAPDGWCVSCWRFEKTHEPVGVKPDGTPYYRGLCRFCGRFKAANGELPTLDLLRLHLTPPYRISERDVLRSRQGR